MAQTKHIHDDEPESRAVTPAPKAAEPDPPVETIADEQRKRSAEYEANLGKVAPPPPEDTTRSTHATKK